MKIVCISRYFFPSIDGQTQKVGHGAEVRIYELYSRLARMGHDVHFVVPSLAAKTKAPLIRILSYTDESFEGISIHRTPSIPPFALTRLFSPCKVIKAVSLKGDLLVTEFHPFHASGYESIVARAFLHLPIILDVHDAAMSLGSPLQPFDQMNESICYNSANGIVVCSEEMGLYVKNKAIKPTSVIPNGVNTKTMKFTDPTEIKKRYGLDGHPIIGFSGSLTKQHGIDYLVMAAPRILEHIKDAKFFVVGGGSEYQNLKSLVSKLGVSDAFVFTGLIPYEKMPGYVSAMDVCVAPFPSGVEFTVNFPLKLSEYLSVGKPIVTTDGNVLVRVLKESGGGVTAKSEDPKDIADKIISLLENPALMKRFGKNGKEYAVRNLDWDILAGRMSDFLETFIGEKHV